MKRIISIHDIKYYINERKRFYLISSLFILIGVLIGIIIVSSSDSYLSLLKGDDKVLFDFINGKTSFSKQLSRMVSKFLVPIFIIFLCNISYYTSFLSFIFLTYDGVLFFMNAFAIISEFGFTGILSFIFLILPINLVLFCIIIFHLELCYSRACVGKKYKKFSYGFNDMAYWLPVLIVIILSIIFSVIMTLLLGIILKNYIFIIF